LWIAKILALIYYHDMEWLIKKHRRIRREAYTVACMIRIFCSDNHPADHRPGAPMLCPECQALQDYANQRLARCPFQDGKTTCANCSVHCYQKQMGERIREVMRYAGPRMLLRHPVLSIGHVWDGRRKKAVRVNKIYSGCP
jgi:hypothetical protein